MNKQDAIFLESRKLVEDFFNGDQVKTDFWFKTRNPNLGNTAPCEFFKRGRGHKVLQFIKCALDENKLEAKNDITI